MRNDVLDLSLDRMDPKVKRSMLKAQDDILNLREARNECKAANCEQDEALEYHAGILRKGKETLKKLLQVMTRAEAIK